MSAGHKSKHTPLEPLSRIHRSIGTKPGGSDGRPRFPARLEGRQGFRPFAAVAFLASTNLRFNLTGSLPLGF